MNVEPRLHTRTLLSIIALALTACAAVSPGRTRSSDVNLSGFPPEYRQAFEAGCERARAGGRLSEAPKFQSAPAQAVQGWHDGFDICSRR